MRRSQKFIAFSQRLRKCSRGTAAIEFAIVGGVFFFMLMGTIILGLEHARGADTDGAVVGMSREVAKSAGKTWSVNDLLAAYCKQTLWPSKCDLNNMIVQAGAPDDAGFSDPTNSFAQIQSGQLNVISVAARSSMLDAFIGKKFKLGSAHAVYVP